MQRSKAGLVPRKARRKRLGWWLFAVVLVALSGLCAASVQAAELYSSSFWKVSVSSFPTKQDNTEAFKAFDFGNFSLSLRGPWLQLKQSGTEFTGTVGAADKDVDGPVTHTLDAGDKTGISITCIPSKASFNASGVGSGTVTANFDDSTGSVFGDLLSTWGSGYAKAVASVKSEGDLAYPKADELTKGGVAVASVENASDVEAEVDVPKLPIKLKFKLPPKGSGASPGVLNASNTADKDGDDFKFTLFTNIASTIRADDGSVGKAASSVDADITHTDTVKGGGCKRQTADPPSCRVSEINFKLNGTATIDIAENTKDCDGGGVTESLVKHYRSPGASYTMSVFDEKFDAKPLGEFGKEAPWAEATSFTRGSRAPGGTGEQSATRSRRVGVRRGSTARYAVRAVGSPLNRLAAIRLGVRRRNRKTGALALRARASYRRGASQTSEAASLTANVFTGKGDVIAFIVPTGLRRGDRLYGFGRVTRVTRRTVHVKYRKRGRGTASAVYSRRTGWLLRLSQRYRGGRISRLVRTR
jgi:hypothetical protein